MAYQSNDTKPTRFLPAELQCRCSSILLNSALKTIIAMKLSGLPRLLLERRHEIQERIKKLKQRAKRAR
tara:strand:- start:45 stop:251 length:207 start_codon:yes stop_codon:yes gene_type:complete